MENNLTYYCDEYRHLICIPYSIENLHIMAEDLGIKRCWFETSKLGYAHYDIPKKRIKETKEKCTIVSTKELLKIIKNETEVMIMLTEIVVNNYNHLHWITGDIKYLTQSLENQSKLIKMKQDFYGK